MRKSADADEDGGIRFLDKWNAKQYVDDEEDEDSKTHTAVFRKNNM